MPWLHDGDSFSSYLMCTTGPVRENAFLAAASAVSILADLQPLCRLCMPLRAERGVRLEGREGIYGVSCLLRLSGMHSGHVASVKHNHGEQRTKLCILYATGSHSAKADKSGWMYKREHPPLTSPATSFPRTVGTSRTSPFPTSLSFSPIHSPPLHLPHPPRQKVSDPDCATQRWQDSSSVPARACLLPLRCTIRSRRIFRGIRTLFEQSESTFRAVCNVCAAASWVWHGRTGRWSTLAASSCPAARLD
jgi:hypothetical protein